MSLTYLPVWKCKACGCLWRDNLDDMVSLLNAEQKSCETCERSPTREACAIHWLQVELAISADLLQQLDDLKRDASWRGRWHARLGRGPAEPEGRFYERVKRIVQEATGSDAPQATNGQIEELLSAFDVLYKYASDDCPHAQYHRYQRPNSARPVLETWLETLHSADKGKIADAVDPHGGTGEDRPRAHDRITRLNEQLRAAEGALTARQTEGWQPIATADMSFAFPPNRALLWGADWDQVMEGVANCGQWIVRNRVVQPTHWMPLPAPPGDTP